MSGLYDQDFNAWTEQQADLLRAGRWAELDVQHLIDEIESMGRSERKELVNRLVILMLHLLKWRYQPALRGNSWRLSIKEQRIRLSSHLDDNPSLKAYLDEAAVRAYRLAVIEAEKQTGLPATTFPEQCPFTFADMADEQFWPDAAG
ncbi:hypothetical protein CKO31_12980 [Thiohalocapsa halophila]|uniref:DUF29 domain-containing protein n=1 Tax=Thiohalocapsa halophila TaxID=69359 RepID=A0ABS1CI98_9GAMM|nr:DUF29 domain-containing protein [Thiohalocapsa halophila]MBK1631641.1 hypothetical protein [Thiohalocapsa halophila]